MKRKLKRKEMRMLLDAANKPHVILACLVRCAHFPGAAYALMSVETAIAHQVEFDCKPERLATSITEMELVAATANGKHRS